MKTFARLGGFSGNRKQPVSILAYTYVKLLFLITLNIFKFLYMCVLRGCQISNGIIYFIFNYPVPVVKANSFRDSSYFKSFVLHVFYGLYLTHYFLLSPTHFWWKFVRKETTHNFTNPVFHRTLNNTKKSVLWLSYFRVDVNAAS